MKRFFSKISFFVILTGVILLSGCEKQKPKTIVCLGNSLTTCGGKDGRFTDYLAKWLPRHRIINKGIGGDTLADGRKRFDKDVISLSPDVVVIELGANDFWQKKRKFSELKADLEYMVTQAQSIGAEVVIASCFGNRDFESEQKIEFGPDRFDYGNAIAKMESEIVAQYNCFYVPNMQVDIKPNGKVPYWTDDNHPNEIGNEFVAKRILAELKKALAAIKKL